MNERMKQLAEQAGIYKLGLSDETEYWIMEKFAQLIVAECIDRIKNADMTDLEGSDPDDVLWLVERQIVKHFGVEE